MYFLEDCSFTEKAESHSLINSLTHLLTKYLLSTHYRPGTTLGAREKGVNKIDVIPTLMEFYKLTINEKRSKCIIIN